MSPFRANMPTLLRESFYYVNSYCWGDIARYFSFLSLLPFLWLIYCFIFEFWAYWMLLAAYYPEQLVNTGFWIAYFIWFHFPFITMTAYFESCHFLPPRHFSHQVHIYYIFLIFRYFPSSPVAGRRYNFLFRLVSRFSYWLHIYKSASSFRFMISNGSFAARMIKPLSFLWLQYWYLSHFPVITAQLFRLIAFLWQVSTSSLIK